MKIVAGIVATIVFISMLGVGTIIVKYNTAINMERSIKAQYTQNQNVRSQYVNSIAEASQVPQMYKEDFKEIVTAAMTGRYGKEGSKAVFQWIKEHNIQFDSSIYRKIQTMIEAGRLRFEREQKFLIDKKRAYEIYLETFPNNIILSMFGFPRIDLSKYKIVTSADNDKVFNTGKESPIKLR